jgi:hypothetical protein
MDMRKQERREREERERERVLQWQAMLEQARERWLGKRVAFADLLDERAKIGRVTSIDERGNVCIEYQLIPNQRDCLCDLYLGVSDLEEVLTLIDD